jgi:hypothetical protein
MGIRSDVALAVKRNVWDSLTIEQRVSIQEVMRWSEKPLEHSQGYLFFWESIKWYHDSYNEIKALYAILDELTPQDFTLICATPEDPNDTSADHGDWWDNPWDLRKIVDVRLEFDTQPDENTEV